jgi:hypothetical protein
MAPAAPCWPAKWGRRHYFEVAAELIFGNQSRLERAALPAIHGQQEMTPPAAAKFVIFFHAARQRDGGMPHPKERAEGPETFAYQVSEHPHAACGWLGA